MSSLSKEIEQYLKELLSAANSGVLEIQRNMLSEYFHCVPSQINYVLSTRFTPAQGYLVESRRGGGGYVRIVSLQLDDDDDLETIINTGIGQKINERNGEGLLDYLHRQGLLTARESRLIGIILKDRVLGGVESKDRQRADMLKYLLAALSLEDY